MTAVPIRIADAVASSINAAPGIAIDDASRRYADWDDKFEDLAESTMVVDVVFRTVDKLSLECDSFITWNPAIHVAVRKRFGQADRDNQTGRLKNSAVDPCVTILEDIYKHFATLRRDTVLDTETEAKWNGEDSVVRSIDQQKLRLGLFEGYIELNFLFSEQV